MILIELMRPISRSKESGATYIGRLTLREIRWVVGVDKNAAYPPAFESIKNEGLVSAETELRQVKYLNNIIEQDHRFSKRRIRYSQWLQTFRTAEATISGYESMHMIRKGQVEGVGRKDASAQKMFIEGLFGIAAWLLKEKEKRNRPFLRKKIFCTRAKNGTTSGFESELFFNIIKNKEIRFRIG